MAEKENPKRQIVCTNRCRQKQSETDRAPITKEYPSNNQMNFPELGVLKEIETAEQYI